MHRKWRTTPHGRRHSCWPHSSRIYTRRLAAVRWVRLAVIECMHAAVPPPSATTDARCHRAQCTSVGDSTRWAEWRVPDVGRHCTPVQAPAARAHLTPLDNSNDKSSTGEPGWHTCQSRMASNSSLGSWALSAARRHMRLFNHTSPWASTGSNPANHDYVVEVYVMERPNFSCVCSIILLMCSGANKWATLDNLSSKRPGCNVNKRSLRRAPS